MALCCTVRGNRPTAVTLLQDLRLIALLPALFVINILLLNGSRDVTTSADLTTHSQGNPEFQAVNSFLSDLGPLSMEPESVVPILKEAIQTIESIGIETFSELDPKQQDVVGTKYVPLIGNDAQILLTVLKNLVTASKMMCDQEQVDYLGMVAKHQTFYGQFLNNYARALIKNCIDANADVLTKKIERSLGKMNTTIFETLKEMSGIIESIQKDRSGRRKISFVEVDSDTEEVVAHSHLKLIDCRDDKRSFALALNQMFNRRPNAQVFKFWMRDKLKDLADLKTFFQTNFVLPCAEPVERLQAALDYFAPHKRLLFDFLEAERKKNVHLDQYLDIYRICVQLRSRVDEIWDELTSMRWSKKVWDDDYTDMDWAEQLAGVDW